METSDFIEDAELNGYINSSIAELHDLLVSSYGSDYFLSNYTFATVPGQSDYALPSTFYKLMGVDLKINNNDYVALRQFNFNARNKRKDSSVSISGQPNVEYRLLGSNLKLTPAPDGANTIQIWYVPKATELVSDSDTLDDLNQFSEFVIVDAAIKMLQKEESDVSILMAQKADIKHRIEIMAQNRDVGQSEHVTDIYDDNNDYWFVRSR